MRKIAVLMVLFALLGSFTAFAQQYDDEDDFRVAVETTGDTRHAVISRYVGDKQIVKIPPSINGLEVWGVQEGVFGSRELISVTFPDTLIDVSQYAFSNNSLTSVTFPRERGYNIGTAAFSNNRISSITINGSPSIWLSAFAGNPLATITISANTDFFDDLQNTRDPLVANVRELSSRFIAFANYYNHNGKKAGTYTFNNGKWNLDSVSQPVPREGTRSQAGIAFPSSFIGTWESSFTGGIVMVMTFASNTLTVINTTFVETVSFVLERISGDLYYFEKIYDHDVPPFNIKLVNGNLSLDGYIFIKQR